MMFKEKWQSGRSEWKFFLHGKEGTGRVRLNGGASRCEKDVPCLLAAVWTNRKQKRLDSRHEISIKDLGRDEREVNFGLKKWQSLSSTAGRESPTLTLIDWTHSRSPGNFLEAISMTPHTKPRREVTPSASFYRCGNWRSEGFSAAAKVSHILQVTEIRTWNHAFLLQT